MPEMPGDAPPGGHRFPGGRHGGIDGRFHPLPAVPRLRVQPHADRGGGGASPISRGRERPLTAEEKERAARFAGLALRLAWEATRAAPAWIDAEAMRSDIGLELVRSARRYRPGRRPFHRHLRRRLEGAVKDAARREARERRRRGEMPGEPACNSRPVGRELEEADALEWWLGKLPGRHAEAMRRIYLLGETHREAARVLGFHPSRVGAIHLQSLTRLRRSEASRDHGDRRHRGEGERRA